MKNEMSIWILENDMQQQGEYKTLFEPHSELKFFNLQGDILARLERQGQEVDILILEISMLEKPIDLVLNRIINRSFPPLFVVSNIDEPNIIDQCLSLGVQDYLCKPYNRAELLSKVKLASNGKPRSTPAVKKGALVVDPLRMTLTREGREVAVLTNTELRIFSLLNDHFGTAISKNNLFTQIWRRSEVGEKALIVHISSLRRKLRNTELDIRCVDRKAYRLLEVAREAV